MFPEYNLTGLRRVHDNLYLISVSGFTVRQSMSALRCPDPVCVKFLLAREYPDEKPPPPVLLPFQGRGYGKMGAES